MCLLADTPPKVTDVARGVSGDGAVRGGHRVRELLYIDGVRVVAVLVPVWCMNE